MNCPYCGKEMKQGALASRNPIFWSEKGEAPLPFPLPDRRRSDGCLPGEQSRRLAL